MNPKVGSFLPRLYKNRTTLSLLIFNVHSEVPQMTQRALKIREKKTKNKKQQTWWLIRLGKWYLGHPETIYEFRSISVTIYSWDSFLSWQTLFPFTSVRDWNWESLNRFQSVAGWSWITQSHWITSALDCLRKKGQCSHNFSLWTYVLTVQIMFLLSQRTKTEKYSLVQWLANTHKQEYTGFQFLFQWLLLW